MVQTFPHSTIYSLSWYMDLASEKKWGVLTDATMKCGMPIAYKKRAGYSNIYQPFYTMYTDIIKHAHSLDDYLRFLNERYDHVHFTSQFPSIQFQTKKRIRQEIILNEFNLKRDYSENAVRQIKKAEKNNVEIHLHTKAEEVTRFFKTTKGKLLKEYKRKDFTILTKIIQESIKRGNGFCAHAVYDNQIVASGSFLKFNKRITYLKGGLNEIGKENGAMYYLIHKVITEHCDNTEVFDFGGSNAPKVSEFYRKLGGQDIEYNEIIIDNENKIQKLIKKLF